MKKQSALSKLDGALVAVENFCICAILSLMLIFSALQVMLRNFFDSGIGWADVFIRHLVLYLLFFGASLSTRGRRHIQMDVSSKIVPKKFKSVVHFCINTFCIVVNFYLYLAALKFTQDEKASGSILFAGIHTWYFIAIMPIGFLLITFRFILNWITDILVLLKIQKPEPEEVPHAHGI